MARSAPTTLTSGQRKAAVTLALVDGSGSGMVLAVVGVLAAQRFGLTRAGVVFSCGAAGRLLVPSLFWWRQRRPALHPHRDFFVLVAAMVGASVAFMAAAAWQTWPVAAAAAVVFAATNSAVSAAAQAAMPSRAVSHAPLVIVGHALGALAASAAFAIAPTAVVVVATVVTLTQFAEPVLLRNIPLPPLAPTPLGVVVHTGSKGLVLAACTYGPLVVYAPLVAATAGPNWVGPAMAAYALGGLLAPRLDKVIPGGDRWVTVLALGVVGVSAWALATTPVLVLLSRFASAAVLFVAQGRLMRLALHGDLDPQASRPTAVAAVFTGFGVGGALAATPVTALAATLGVPAMAGVLATVTLAAALVSWGLAGRHERRSAASHAPVATSSP